MPMHCTLSLMPCLALPYFSTLSHKWHDSGEKVIQICVLIFSTTFVWNISHSKRNSVRYYKCAQVFMYSTRYSCQIWMRAKSYQQIFEKYSNVKFYDNVSCGSWFVPHGWTDGQMNQQDEANNGVYNFANMPKLW